jgi:hypothetical protein
MDMAMDCEPEDEDSDTEEFEDDPIDKAFRRSFVLDAEAFDQWVEMLDSPPEPSEALRKLMSMKPRWEE